MLVFILISVIPLIITGLIAVDKSNQTIRNEVENSLNTIADYKVLQIQKYFDNQETLGQVLARSPVTKAALQRLPQALNQGVESTEYQTLDTEIRDFLEYYKEKGNFEDIYLISDDADIVFSLQRKSDFATNLYDGPYKSAPIAYAYDLSLMMRGSNFTGFQPYQPSGGNYSAFLAIPVFSERFPSGVIAFQISIDAINAFATDYTGLKNSGEVMLVKQEFDKLLLVSPLRHESTAGYMHYLEPGEDKYVPLQLAAKGESSSGRYRDYRNRDTIAAWRYLPRLHWGMLVKIDEIEAFEGGQQLEDSIVLLGICCVILVLIFGLLFSRRLSQPITRLARATRRIAGGELDYQVAVRGYDEIGELGHSFNKMTKQLKKSLDQAQAAAVAKSQFLTTMSHEIRTPMSGVLGMAQLLEDTKLDEEQQEYVQVINQSGNRLLGIINDILDFSQLDDDIEMGNTIFDLEQVALECLESVAIDVSNKGLQLIFDYQARSPRLLIGDSTRIAQVIYSLLNNAVKFTESGYICLAISVSVLRGRTALIGLEVKDTGIGIDSDRQGNLFAAFSQVDQSISRRFGGTGLGLAMSHRIIELMDGEITVDSSPGEGSCFKVSLNLVLADEASSDTGLELISKTNVLLVDHNPVSQCSIRGFLDSIGATVTTINDIDAINLTLKNAVLSNPFQLLIIHAGNELEAMLEVVAELCRDKEIYQISVMLYAPLGEKAELKTFADIGVDAYLCRFYSREQIRNIIDELMQQKYSVCEVNRLKKKAS